MQAPSTDFISAFCYGSTLQSTINAANLLRAQTGVATLSFQQPQLDSQNCNKDKKVSPFDPEAIVPLPTQLSEFKARNFGTTIWRRNERERYRVRCVNDAYDNLRQVLPFDEEEKRLSKVETLRLAIIYIKHLDRMLLEAGHEHHCSCFIDFQAQLLESEAKRIDQRLSLSGRESDES
ncbi:hypothetical protein FO519_009776 [Halicephalobus sp. NKZ332]|nr:hypothetical protein FO519_009776 [Halicephalobus sp. NKZ332]